MNSVQMHLALTHVPVILSVTGLIMLIVSFFIKNRTVTQISYLLVLIAGLAAVPVFLTGEGTEETIENLPGVSENIIESHEKVAKLAMISIAITGLAALSAMFLINWKISALTSKLAVLVLASVSGILMARTAHLGGQIRHTEIQNGFALQQNDAADNNNPEQGEKDDD